MYPNINCFLHSFNVLKLSNIYYLYIILLYLDVPTSSFLLIVLLTH